MSAVTGFDPAPPSPYSGKWKEAAVADKEEGKPRFTTYQAPGGSPIPFVLESFDFSGGQSVDTAEYPFHGYWSNESLNEKAQQLTVDGFIRGANYIAKRNALIQSLRVKTDDANPGYIDFPFWGRFPVVVMDYSIKERTNEQGQCALSLTFTRAGVTADARLAAIPDVAGLFDSAKETLKAAAIEDFENTLKSGTDSAMLVSSFIKMKAGLLAIVGRVQAAKTRLAVLTNEAGSFISLINQGIRAPKELAAAFLAAVSAIAGGIISIGEALRVYGARGSDGYGSAGAGGSGEEENASGGTRGAAYFTRGENNEKNALVYFLAASDYTLSDRAATAAAQNTKEACENLYRTAALLASSEILLAAEDLSYQKTMNYWTLLQKLETAVSRDDPAVHAALLDTRVAVSRNLAARELSNEMKRALAAPLPLLCLSHYLGCDEARLRQLNGIADSFVIKEEVVYV
jgi:prophage DNA circulation protein